jgi:hypothetical protein
LAELWLAIGTAYKAREFALAGYRWAWADGEPYVSRHDLEKARAMLGLLGVEYPELRRYDPTKDPKLPWEDDLHSAIAKLRAEAKPERKRAGKRSGPAGTSPRRKRK